MPEKRTIIQAELPRQAVCLQGHPQENSYVDDVMALLNETLAEVRRLNELARSAMQCGDRISADAHLAAGKAILDIADTSLGKSGIKLGK